MRGLRSRQAGGDSPLWKERPHLNFKSRRKFGERTEGGRLLPLQDLRDEPSTHPSEVRELVRRPALSAHRRLETGRQLEVKVVHWRALCARGYRMRRSGRVCSL